MVIAFVYSVTTNVNGNSVKPKTLPMFPLTYRKNRVCRSEFSFLAVFYMLISGQNWCFRLACSFNKIALKPTKMTKSMYDEKQLN